jgi:hypothetical protein
LVLALCAMPALAADRVTGSAENGYRRLSFSLDGAAKVSATSTGGVLAVSFDRAPTISADAVMAAAPGLITSGRADGTSLRFALSQPVKLHVHQQGDRAVVDLAPLSFNGTMPDLPPPPKPAPPKPIDVASLPEIKLRAGNYSNFTRLVFDWTRNVPYSVFPGAGKLTIRFGAPTRFDLSILGKLPPAWVKTASWRLDGGSTLVEISTDSDSGYHDFRDGPRIVLDILAPKTDAAAYAPPGQNKPTVTKMVPGASAAQAQAIAVAAAALQPKKPEPKPAQAPKPEPQAEKPAKAAEAAPLPNASGQLTPTGASLTFRNAASAAVFIRGLTAWVVLPNAPAPDIAALKKALGGFAVAVEGSSSPGLSILRITLKDGNKIASRADGPNLRVVIGPGAAAPVSAIGFARNQADPKRTSLTTTLPRAGIAVPLTDPASGDTLTVIPSAPGHAMPAQKVFADFAALPTAQGLVIAAYTDDLTITVADARVTIARPGGMALTPPQMPVASSPAALAGNTGGPSYLDLAGWAKHAGGSFLATQRALAHDLAKLPPQQRNPARLKLARFYLAQGMAAESLGLINLIQLNDPALKGDIQLSTMRAAAAVQMGRYRDARNELASPMFDSDRNALLWRGLADAGLENWKEAQRELEAAEAVLPRYPAEWQVRAVTALAEAALGNGRVDLADATISRLPPGKVPAAQSLEVRLVKARIAAAESRYHVAMPEFTAIEKAGNERMAARAIYYRTETALAAGMTSQRQAIDALERLRFRWRGDGLELKTLRKLASLYFKANNWRDGLRTLRVATQNFRGNDARLAQDDMRAAFINLYLKGAADKLSPVESLAMFQDHIDLTPIGPDGDEMIRRMSDRLVAVDLLGPASDLLAYQVEKRLDGIAKAQVAARLAAVQLMNRKPDAAIASLRNSQITGLPDDVIHARLILEARAFAAMKQYDNALDLLGVDQGADTRQLRADIYWETGNWAVAGQKIEEMLGARFSDPTALTPAERMDVLRTAVAYSLANDEKSLERLRTNFAAKMKGTPDMNLFAVLSQPIDQHGLAFREAAAKIASVDTLRTFMTDFTKKFAAAKGS